MMTRDSMPSIIRTWLLASFLLSILAQGCSTRDLDVCEGEGDCPSCHECRNGACVPSGEPSCAQTPDGGPRDARLLDGAPSSDSAPLPDTSPVEPSHRCAAPARLTLGADQKVRVEGDTAAAFNEFDDVIDCGRSYTKFTGPQHYYVVQLLAQTPYRIRLTRSTSWEAALYLFEPSAACKPVVINKQCDGHDRLVDGKDPTEVLYTPTATGDIIIAVDGQGTNESGPYTLTVEAFAETTPNDTCAAAEALSFGASNAITVASSTTGATNQLDMDAAACVAGMTKGPERFYELPLVAGDLYDFALTAPGWDAWAYLFTLCSAPTDTCSNGMATPQPLARKQPLSFSYQPSLSANYKLGVDGYGADDYGPFSLSIKRWPRPADACADAEKLSFKGDTIVQRGSTLGLTNTLDISAAGCVGKATPMAEAFYQVELEAGKTYHFKLEADLFVDVDALYLLSSCQAPAQSCVKGAVYSSGGVPKVSFSYTPTVTGTVTVVVDQTDSYMADEGAYTLTISR